MDLSSVMTIVQLTQLLSGGRSVLIVYSDGFSELSAVSRELNEALIPTVFWEAESTLPPSLFMGNAFRLVLLLCGPTEAQAVMANAASGLKWLYVSRESEGDPLLGSDFWARMEYPHKVLVAMVNESACADLLLPEARVSVGSGGCGRQLDFDLSLANQLWDNMNGRVIRTTTVNRDNVQGVKLNRKSGKTEGFGMIFDILNLMTSRLNFSYVPLLSPDSFYGSKLANGSWDGMMKQIINKEAELTAAVFQTTEERSEVVAFSLPIFDEDMHILQPRPQADRTGEGVFYPFTTQVWIVLIFTIVGVSLAIFALTLTQAALMHQRRMSLAACTWMVIRLLLSQAGKSSTGISLTSSRLAMVAWGLFTLIVSSMYTANLTAFLTIPKYNVGVKDLKALQAKKSIRWMVKKSAAFISEIESELPSPYTSLRPDLTSGRAMTVSNDKEALELILSSGFVYLQKATTVESLILDDFRSCGECRLAVGTSKFFRTPTSIAFPIGSPYRTLVDDFVLSLKSFGITDHLYSMYYPTASGVCVLSASSDDMRPIGISSFDYTYLILIFGLALALFILILELFSAKQFAGKLFKSLSCRLNTAQDSTTIRRIHYQPPITG